MVTPILSSFSISRSGWMVVKALERLEKHGFHNATITIKAKVSTLQQVDQAVIVKSTPLMSTEQLTKSLCTQTQLREMVPQSLSSDETPFCVPLFLEINFLLMRIHPSEAVSPACPLAPE